MDKRDCNFCGHDVHGGQGKCNDHNHCHGDFKRCHEEERCFEKKFECRERKIVECREKPRC